MADKVYPKEALVGCEELAEAIAEGKALEFFPEEYGTVVILGIGQVIRRGHTVGIVEMHADGQIHRGRLIPNQIMPGSRITVKNSGGKHRSPVLQAAQPRITDGDAFRSRLRSSLTPRRDRW